MATAGTLRSKPASAQSSSGESITVAVNFQPRFSEMSEGGLCKQRVGRQRNFYRGKEKICVFCVEVVVTLEEKAL